MSAVLGEKKSEKKCQPFWGVTVKMAYLDNRKNQNLNLFFKSQNVEYYLKIRKFLKLNSKKMMFRKMLNIFEINSLNNLDN